MTLLNCILNIKKIISKFVCDSFDSMPPSSGFEIISLHLVALMDEIANLKNELKEIKDSGIRSNILIDDSTLIKNDLLQIKENIRDLKLKLYENEVRRLRNSIMINEPIYRFNIFQQYATKEFYYFLTTFINLCFLHSYIPPAFIKGIIIPLVRIDGEILLLLKTTDL